MLFVCPECGYWRLITPLEALLFREKPSQRMVFHHDHPSPVRMIEVERSDRLQLMKVESVSHEQLV